MATKKPAALRSALPNLLKVFRHLTPYLKPQRRFIIIGFSAMLFEVGFRLIEPWPLKYVIDEVIAKGDPVNNSTWVQLGIAAAAVAGAVGLRALASYLMTVCFALAGTRSMAVVRGDVYAHIQKLSLRFHGKKRSGDILTRLISDVGRLQEVSVTAAMPLLGNVIALIAMTIVMFVLDLQLACVVFLAFPIFMLLGSSSSKKITAAARKQRHREGDLAGMAGETLGAMKLIQAYSLEDEMQRAFAVSNKNAMKDGVKASRLSAALERKVDLLVGCATAVVLVLGGARVLNGELTIGELLVFNTYLKASFKPMRDLAKYTGRLSKAAASGERILEILDAEPDVQDSPEAISAPRLAGRVTLSEVTVDYDGLHALEDVSIDISPGSRVGIIGKSGSGKSTIASLLLRLQDPSSGQVLLDGHDIRDLLVDSVRSQIAIVLQDSVLFATTVRENIRYGRPDATDSEVYWVAKQANVHEFVEEMPDGYDTILGERGSTVSGGQRQRIAIARAMLRDARIIILDEASAGLDTETSNQVTEALRRLTIGRTTVVISHDMADIEDLDEVVILDRGRIVGQGHPWRFLNPFLSKPIGGLGSTARPLETKRPSGRHSSAYTGR